MCISQENLLSWNSYSFLIHLLLSLMEESIISKKYQYSRNPLKLYLWILSFENIPLVASFHILFDPLHMYNIFQEYMPWIYEFPKIQCYLNFMYKIGTKLAIQLQYPRIYYTNLDICLDLGSLPSIPFALIYLSCNWKHTC